MQHEFFHPKTLTGQPKTASITETTAKETTAETNVSRVESIILGNNNLQIKTRILEQSPCISQTRNLGTLEESSAKKSAKKAGNRNSIIAQKSLEPILENA